MAVVTIDITAVSGTSPTADFWLQGYDRFAKQWFDVPYDQQLTSNAAAAAPSARHRLSLRDTSPFSSCCQSP